MSFGQPVDALERTARALVHSTLFVSLSAASWVVTTAVLLGLDLDIVPAFIAFSATLFVYALNRLSDGEEDARNVPDRAAFTRRYGTVAFAVGVASFALATVLALRLDVPVAAVLLVAPLLGVAYSTGRLKRLFLVKNLLVGLGWGMIPLGTGVYYGLAVDLELLALVGYVTAVVTVAAAVFDVKDVAGDRRAGIRTLPTVYGPRVTRRVTALANVAIAVAVIAVVAAGALPARYLALLACNCYIGLYIPFATPERGPLFYGVVVDGEHLALALVVGALAAAGLIG